MTKTKRVLLYATVFLASFGVTRFLTRNPTDLTKNAVMIVNKGMTHGGTGIIYKSGTKGSWVLTNRHVCIAVKDGGVIRSTLGNFQVQSFLESQVSDLCLIYSPANLKQETRVSSFEPKPFTDAKVAGHPALLPTVITYGHFSDRQIISVMTGTRPCTDADASDPYCAFFGVIPIVKSYDSQLVSATIMPGSSGSGVYNYKNELSGVVFAGQGDFGYGWIVTHDQVVQFLQNEVNEGTWTTIDQTLTSNASEEKKDTTKEMLKKCVNATDRTIINFCTVLRRDVLWSN